MYDKYECNCAANFTGTHCSDCIPGNIGTNCDEVVNPCEPEPCKNNGTCSPNKDEYTCDCTGLGYFGDHCEIRIDPCTK